MGVRVVIPKWVQQQLLIEVHSGHPRMVRMKHVVRSFMWWPGIDNEIEATAKSCDDCLQTRHMPSSTTHQWERPRSAAPCWFSRTIHGTCSWLSLTHILNGLKSRSWKMAQHQPRQLMLSDVLFATWGICKQLHTDNGPQFTSAEFQNFMKQHGVQHTTSAVYHPTSNGRLSRMLWRRWRQNHIHYRSQSHSLLNHIPYISQLIHWSNLN